MELRQLKTFVLIAKLSSFTAAAGELGYAQSTVTTQIRLLEEELGVRLLERFGHRVSLTAAGELLLAYARQMLHLDEEARSRLSPAAVPQGVLTLGTGESVSTYYLPEWIGEFRQRYPAVEVVLRVDHCSAIRAALKRHELDAGLILDRPVSDEDYAVTMLAQERLRLVCTPGHPLVERIGVKPEDLQGAALILTEPGCSFRASLLSMLEENGIRPGHLLEAGSIETIKRFAAAGLGIALLPEFAVTGEKKQQRLTWLDWQGPEFDYRIQFITHRDKWMSPAMTAFLAMARRRLTAVCRDQAGNT